MHQRVEVGGPARIRHVRSFQFPSRYSLNKGLLVGQKKPLQPKHVWSIRARLELGSSTRDLALFNLAIDSKLRACDLVRLRMNDLCQAGKVRDRATVIQQKTGRPVKFEIMIIPALL